MAPKSDVSDLNPERILHNPSLCLDIDTHQSVWSSRMRSRRDRVALPSVYGIIADEE